MFFFKYHCDKTAVILPTIWSTVLLGEIEKLVRGLAFAPQICHPLGAKVQSNLFFFF